MAIKLIIFDFDGTLADTTAAILETYRLTIENLDLPFRSEAECQATIGFPLKEGFRHLYPDFTDALLETCISTYRKIFNEIKKVLVPALYPGVRETLTALAEKGIVMTVASSRSRVSLVEFCENTGIADMFALILGADDVARAKPDPEPVLHTLRHLGVKAEEAMVVGDMPVDISMGKGAGCQTVGVTYGNSDRRQLTAAGATYIIDRFPALLDLLK